MKSSQTPKSNDKKSKQIIILLGATATGKSSLAIRLASELNGEIVNADSRQIYRFMDIGTAKPSTEEMSSIPHHLYSIVNPDEYFSAAHYTDIADEIIDNICSRGKLPIVTGGTGMYIRALLNGLFKGPPKDEALRQRLTNLLEDKGINYLYRMLCRVDSNSCIRINSSDKQRIIRALEVYFLTGSPMSDFMIPPDFERYRAVKIGLTMEREKLYKQINSRVDKMIKSGFIEEVSQLMKKGYGNKDNAFKALGYCEIQEYINGNISLDDACSEIKKKSRNYAKRQITWFKKENNVVWFEADGSKDLFLEVLSFTRSALSTV